MRTETETETDTETDTDTAGGIGTSLMQITKWQRANCNNYVIVLC